MTEPTLLDFDALVDGDTLQALGAAIKQEVGGAEGARRLAGSASWLGGKAVDAIGDAMRDFDLLGAFAAAWAGAREVADHGDPNKHPSTRAHRLRLGKHDIDIDLHPDLVVKVGEWSSPPIEFTLALSAAVEAVELRVKQGFITAVGGGICELKVELSRGTATLMPRRSLHKFDLPGDHRFASPGVDIRPQHLR